jgi:two-component system chemotaxis response regulator CheB
MSGHSIVVIGASAGGVEGLLALARSLPVDLPAAVFMVLHIPPHSSSVLPQLLTRARGMPAVHPKDGAPIQPGHIYVAPPDQHLLLDRTHVRLGRGPYENGHRPAVDTLFRSAARWHGPRAVGVVLSGALDDGTAGLSAIKLAGGVTVVQDPADALYPSMPQSALDNVPIDHVAPLASLGALIKRLVTEPAATTANAPSKRIETFGQEALVAEEGAGSMDPLENRGVPSPFACPDCHGVLWELKDGELVRFRCRVGHAYLPQSLAGAQSERVQEALWIALRALKESSALSLRMAERATRRNMETLARAYEERARAASERAGVIEAVLKSGHIHADSPAEPAGNSE